MSSSAGRYRSKLLNFCSRQTRRLIDNSDRALRHIRVGASWGAQILLYPAYVIFQTARLATKQLQQAVQRTTDSAAQQLPAADTPIQRVLETAVALSPSGDLMAQEITISENFHPEIAAKSYAEIDQKPAIQGLATILETGTLVLVTTQNEILDILTEQQRQIIYKKISLEVSDYLHHRILAQTANANIIHQLPPLEDRPHLFPPIRLFRQVMAWVQTGRIATLANIFQEEKIILNLETKKQQLLQKSQELKQKNQQLQQKSQSLKLPNHQSETAEIQSPSLIAKLDSTIAELEVGNLAVMSEVTSSIAHRGQEFVELVKTRLTDSHPLNLPPSEIEDDQTNQFSMLALIKAAVDYFFATEQDAKLPPQPTAAIGYTPDSPITEIDPWLTETDVFGNTGIANQKPVSHPQTASEISLTLHQLTGEKIPVTAGYLPDSPQKDHNFGKDIRTNIKNYSQTKREAITVSEAPFSQPAKHKNKKKNNPNPNLGSPAQNHTSGNNKSPRYPSNSKNPPKPVAPSAKQQKKNNQITHQSSRNPVFRQMDVPVSKTNNHHHYESDWIEIKAKPVGYVKHPLEKILEWLDSSMLWLEELVGGIFQEFLQLFRGKK